MTKRFVTGSKSSFHSDKCCSEFQQWSNGKFANQAWKSNQKRLTSELKHLSLHFLLEGQMAVCDQVRAVKNVIIPLADKSHLMSLSPLQQVAGGSCLTALGAPAAPALVSLPRSQQCPSSLLPACLHLGPFQGPWEPQIRDFQSQTGHRMAYCSGSGAKAVLTEVDFGPAKSSHCSQSRARGAAWACFLGRHPLHRAEPFPGQWQQPEGPAGTWGHFSVTQTATTVAEQWAPHCCSLSPKVNKCHPALLLFVLLQPPAFPPCSDKEQPGQREGKHVLSLLNNRAFCNTLICEAANTRKGHSSVKPLWPPEADKNFTIDSISAVWGKLRHCSSNVDILCPNKSLNKYWSYQP